MNSLPLYRALLRLPAFKGKARLTEIFRAVFYSPRSWRVEPGIQVVLRPLDWVQSDILRDGQLEPLTSSLLASVLRTGDTYVDVGAHIGFHTLLARHAVGETGTLLALEPQPHNCAQLLDNCRANDFSNIVLYVAAAGESDDVVALHLQTGTDTSCLSLAGGGVNDQSQCFHVPLFRLDRLIPKHGIQRLRLLKVDVEGYELQVLRGLGDYIHATDNIILEILQPAHPNSTLICEFLAGAGFTLKTVKGELWDRCQPAPENNVWATRPG